MKRTVLFIAEAGDSTCAHYRAWQPAKGLDKRGWQVAVTSFLFAQDDGRITGLVDVGGHELRPLEPAKVVICRRINGIDGELLSSASMFRRAREAGQIVLMDIDDDLWHLPKTSPAWRPSIEDEIAIWEADMRACDGVICATPTLAKVVRDKLRNKVDVFVCRSGIDPKAFAEYRHTEDADPLRLGWLGATDFRGDDLAMIVPALREALDGRWGEVEFWHLGASDDKPSVRTILGRNFPVQIVERPWVPIAELPRSLAQINCAIIPMVDSKFNRARSLTTGMALMAARIPYVASYNPEYDMAWQYGGVGHVVQGNSGIVDNQKWWQKMLPILTDKEYEQTRKDMAMAGLQYVQRFDLLNSARQWEEVFAQLIS